MGVYLPLPSAYQEVEYIQSSGTQYIDTGISVGTSANGEIIEGKIQFNSNTSGQANGKNQKAGLFFGTDANNKFYASSGSAGTWGATSVTNDYQPHTFKIAQSETKLYIDGIGYSFSGNTLGLSGTANIYIGACGDGYYNYARFYCKENIYRFRIWTNGTLQRDFIPCYRKSDNVIGLYDLVNSQFYTNSGTGTFSKGADVTAIPLKNAYIGEYKEDAEYTADLSTYTLMRNDWGGTAVYQNGYITSTYEGGFAYKNVSNEIDISNAKIIEFEYENYTVGKAWSDGVKGYLQIVPPDGKMTTQSTPTLGVIVATQTSSGYNTRNVLIFNNSSYANTSTGGWVPNNARSTVKGVFDLENGTASYVVNGVQKWTGTMPAADVQTIKNTTFLYVNLSVEVNNKMQNVKVKVHR